MIQKYYPYLLLLCMSLLFSHCSLFKPVETDYGRNEPASSEDRFRQDIVSYAEQFLGTRYKYAGTSPRTGFDCSGFTSYVMDNFDIRLPRQSSDQEKEGQKIRIEDVRPGDLVFYRRNRLGKVFHVSLVVANDREGITVIHSVSNGVVMENVTRSSYWKPKLSSARNVLTR